MVCYPAWERERSLLLEITCKNTYIRHCGCLGRWVGRYYLSHFHLITICTNLGKNKSSRGALNCQMNSFWVAQLDQYFKLFWPVWQFSWLNLEHTHSHNNDSGTIVNITYWNIALLTNLVNVLVFLTLHSVFLRYNCSSPNHKYINHTCGLSQVHLIVLNKDDCKMNESFHTLISRTRKFNSTR